MKKIYLCALALSVGSASFAQSNKANLPTKAKLGVNDTPISTPKITNDKAPGDVLWSEDFTGGFPGTWTTGGADGSNWVINSAAISGAFTNTGAILSTSGGNHMLFFGETINPIADRDAYFETDAIALTGQSSVAVKFEQKFRLCCQSAAELNLVVSTDPSFPATAATMTYPVRMGVAINAQSADPLVTSINISNLVAGYTGNIYLRFHWASGASHYYWMVDDIQVIENVENDLIVFDEYYGSVSLPYTKIPVDQIQPIDFAMQTTNVGALAQANTVLTAEVNTGSVFTGTSAPVTVPTMILGSTIADVSDSLFTTTQWTPPASPLNTAYTIDLTIASSATDNTPGNNTFSFPPLEVDQYIYAMDDYSATPGNGGGFSSAATGSVEEFEAGNFYDIVTNDVVYNVEVMIGSNAVAGNTIEAFIYELDASGNFVQVDRSNIVQITAATVGTLISFPMPNTPTLTAGKTYFAGIHSYSGAGEFFYGTSGSSPGPTTPGGVTSLIYYPTMTNPGTGTNFYTSSTPMIRLDFNPLTSVNSIVNTDASFNVYPNPSTGEFNINLNNDMGATVNLMVKNVVGQTIINKQIAVTGNQVETISLAGYDKGIYFLTINNETVKLIVE